MNGDTTGDEPGKNAADEGATAALPTPDEGATSALPADNEGATQIMSGEAADTTRVMPAGGGAPPPSRPEPTLMMSRAPKQPSSNAWWIVLLVIVLAAAAAAALWFFVLRPKTPTAVPVPAPSAAVDWSGAWGRTDGSGGGLIIQRSGSSYQVTLYDGGLHALGVATAKESGTQLSFTLDTQATLNGLTGPFTVTLTLGASHDTAQMTIVSASQDSATVGLSRVSSLVPATPTTSPPPSTSPSSSPSPSGSPSTSADQQAILGATKIQVGIVTWATNHAGSYPVASDVAQGGGVAQYVSPWPTNPFTSQPMKAGTQPGDYTYEQIGGGSAYKLTAYLSNGLTYALP